MLRDLILRSRTYRRFKQKTRVSRETLSELVDLARLSPSGGNRQPLKYMLSCDPESNAAIFPHLTWAGYLKDWRGPADGERPSAYVIVLGDTEIGKDFGCDHGIAAQSIMLGACEKGLGGCMVGSIDRKGLRKALSLPDRYAILLVLALGVPAETVKLEETGTFGDIEYWRDPQGVHHVPKRPLSELIVV
jgi:nitroreductase